MARLVTWAALVVAAGVTVGCGPAKELPDAVPLTPDAGDTPPAVPAASDPATKAYIEKVVKAYTGGKLELVAKGKASRVTLTGTMRDTSNPDTPISATRSIAAVWPDRASIVNDIVYQGKKMTIGSWLKRPNLVILEGNVESPLSNRVEVEQNLASDVAAQHWMGLLLPLTDPAAIVFDLRKQAFQQRPIQALKLSLGAYPLYQLYFDAKTDALLSVEYTLKEQGSRRRKQWNMTEHKPGPAGLLLPSKMECRHDTVVVEEWAADKWEFPATIDDAEFSPPKK
ncbi:Rossmann-fold NAD(P)-binding domain-containing protein [Frigoriglobus tundricola]|uniref:Uncharacterized protein n=1 Tax=Frigoriglobus tundricola TaxID=2774151 RepID=A0A6M5YF75_9BACT|nr:hypothetical protein [Frigoriglobus tundricola]QJW92657.1 hypothetical protein FTUN_0154 [Frigoriglobus tundricola]